MDNFVSIDVLHGVLGGKEKIATATLYAAVKAGQVPSVRIGRRILIPRWFIEKITKAPESNN